MVPLPTLLTTHGFPQSAFLNFLRSAIDAARLTTTGRGPFGTDDDADDARSRDVVPLADPARATAAVADRALPAVVRAVLPA